jgi:hypothetical protein
MFEIERNCTVTELCSAFHCSLFHTSQTYVWGGGGSIEIWLCGLPHTINELIVKCPLKIQRVNVTVPISGYVFHRYPLPLVHCYTSHPLRHTLKSRLHWICSLGT